MAYILRVPSPCRCADSSNHPPTGQARRLASALVVIAVLITIAGCRRPSASKPLAITGETMGTTYSIKIARLPKSRTLAEIKSEIDKRLETVNDQMSTYRPNSELSRFNRYSKADWFPVSTDTARVVVEAKRVSKLSGGAFDVTVGPLVDLWSFGPENRPKKVPTDVEILKAKQRVGDQRLDVRNEPPGLKKTRADVSVDLSAIAKGFGVDRVAEYLDELKIPGYMIEIGGEIRCKGTKAGGGAWKIGIQSPGETGKAAFGVVALNDASMATSGDYRNYFERNGRRFSHTIDPRTGRPVTHRLASVTVVVDKCMTADALATAIMVLGPDAGYNFAERHGFAVLFLVSESDGFRKRATRAFQKKFGKSQ